MKYKDGNQESVTANISEWATACIEAAENPNFFKTFRRNSIFLDVIEGSPVESGIYNLNRLLENKIFIDCLELIQNSEFVGFPKNLIDFEVNGMSYSLNPTTLRYANNLMNL